MRPSARHAAPNGPAAREPLALRRAVVGRPWENRADVRRERPELNTKKGDTVAAAPPFVSEAIAVGCSWG